MRRRIDDIAHWHCPHACEHAPEAPRAWRYSITSGDSAFALVVSASGFRFELHRAFILPEEQRPTTVQVPILNQAASVLPLGGVVAITQPRELGQCDLLKGGRCVVDLDGVAVAGPDGDGATAFWKRHAKQDSREQAEAFWRALEVIAREKIQLARLRRYPTETCPRCGGLGRVRQRGPTRKEA